MKRKYWNNSYDFKNKRRCINNYNDYMLVRTNEMFRYEGLPDTIPARLLELMLQQDGFVCWYEHEGNLYVFNGSLGGEPDEYYQPTICTINNPALHLDKHLVIDEDCIIMNNDALRIGLLPLNKKYSSLLTENDLTMRIFDITTRMSTLLSASDDRTRNAAENYLRGIENGDLGVIAENALLDGIKAQNTIVGSGSGILSQLIEFQQYLKASWFNDLGLQSNYNMKRESINSNEAQLNEDALLPLVDNMLNERKKALEKVNEMFNTNISVELSSSWEDNQEELELAHDMVDAEGEDDPEDITEESDEDGGEEDEEKDE